MFVLQGKTIQAGIECFRIKQIISDFESCIIKSALTFEDVCRSC